MQPSSLKAPAKINLTLEVLARRADGYHGLRSVVVPVGLYDTLHWQAAAEYRFTCSDPLLAGPDNLAARAAKAIGLEQCGVALHLDKIIPYGAGLGGGSSDAAAVLRAAMNGAFPVARDQDWLGIAASLGSDVPLFLLDGPALIEGRGERVTALGAAPPWYALIVYPACRVATRAAYAELAARPPAAVRPRAGSVGMQLVSALQRAQFAPLLGLLHNDFHEPISALHAPIAQTLAAFAAIGEQAMLSGSGSAVFVLFENEARLRAQELALRNTNALPDDSRCFAVPFAPTTSWSRERAREMSSI